MRVCEGQCVRVSVFIKICKFQWLKSDARFEFQVELERASRLWFTQTLCYSTRLSGAKKDLPLGPSDECVPEARNDQSRTARGGNTWGVGTTSSYNSYGFCLCVYQCVMVFVVV